MNNSFLALGFATILSLSCASCNRTAVLESVKYDYYRLDSDLEKSTAIGDYISPYRNKLEAKMNEVLATSSVPLERTQPESRLGNFVCDLLVEEMEEYTEQSIDLCIMNLGGLRLPVLDQGDITLGDVYELMPFDNTLTILSVSGHDLLEFIQHIVDRGGWPVSKELQIISDGSSLITKIHGRNLIEDRMYKVLTNSYLASGGDDCSFIKNWQGEDFPILIRDLIIEHLKEQTAAGYQIYSELSSRIIIF